MMGYMHASLTAYRVGVRDDNWSGVGRQGARVSVRRLAHAADAGDRARPGPVHRQPRRWRRGRTVRRPRHAVALQQRRRRNHRRSHRHADVARPPLHRIQRRLRRQRLCSYVGMHLPTLITQASTPSDTLLGISSSLSQFFTGPPTHSVGGPD